MLAPMIAGLQGWIQAAAPDATWMLEMPADKTPVTTISASTYLLEMMPAPVASTGRRPPLRWTLRFLVTCRAPDEGDAHALLIELALSAAAQTDWQIEQEPVPVQVWTAFGMAPRPSFVVRMPLEIVQDERVAAPPAKALSINGDLVLSLRGVLLGPGDIPLANGSIELAALHLRTGTNHRGEFCLMGVPGSTLSTLHVRARGSSLDVECRAIDHVTSPLILRMSNLEG